MAVSGSHAGLAGEQEGTAESVAQSKVDHERHDIESWSNRLTAQ